MLMTYGDDKSYFTEAALTLIMTILARESHDNCNFNIIIKPWIQQQ